MWRNNRSVAVLLDLSRPYDRQIVRGIARYVRLHDPWLVYVEENPADKIPSFAEWRGDGMIVDTDDRQTAKAIPQFKGAVVGIGSLAPDVLKRLRIATVSADNRMIAEWAADHLLKRGHKRFAYCGMRTRGLDRWSDIRRDAFARRVAARGHPCEVFTGRGYAPRHWTLMQSELIRWLGRLPKPVGVMACNDLQGRRLLEACRELELRVPEDVAVVGVDNDELMCELSVPPLSSIAPGAQQIGYQAAMLLDALFQRRRRTKHLVVPPAYLVPRQSTDLIAIDDPLVSKAIRFIRDRAAQRIGVPDVVRHLDVSRSTIETRFKRHLQRTVHDEIQRVRLEIARRLLTTSNEPLHVVAERAGYRTVQYMSVVFRRELGYTPGYFRREAGLR